MPDKTLLIVRVNVSDLGKLDEAVEALRGLKSGAVKDVKREPIGFGVEVIRIGIVIDSKDESLPEKALAEIRALPQVENAETEGMTLL